MDLKDTESDQPSTPAIDVLVVDDEELIVELVEHALTSSGYNVRTASCGAAALALLRDRPTDLLISDIRMPRMDGLELALQVRESFPNTHIILMTGYFSDYSQGCADEIGIDEIVKKPFRTSKMLEIVKRISFAEPPGC